MPDTIVERVHAILRARNPHADLHPQLLLGADGLGLDSIALVEVLLECEEALGVTIASELLAATPLTIAALVDALRARVQE